MEVILTDVTFMSGTHVCIAGWDTAHQRLVRPLLPGVHWTTSHIGPGKFETGSVVDFVAAGVGTTGNFPHRTEDVMVTGRFTIKGTLDHNAIHAAISSSLTTNLDAYFAFSNPMTAKRHTPDGTRAPSLGGIIAQRRDVRFYETTWDGKRKLRCTFTIPGQHAYDFPVTSVELRNAWRSGGIPALDGLLAGHAQLHLRTGLARGWSPSGGPPVCYCQLNNLLLI